MRTQTGRLTGALIAVGLATALAGCGAASPGAAIASAADGLRGTIDKAHDAANQATLAGAKTTIMSIIAAGNGIDEESLTEGLERLGLTDVQTRIKGDAVEFGAAVPGGCLFGSVSGMESVTIDLGGAYADGSCLAPE